MPQDFGDHFTTVGATGAFYIDARDLRLRQVEGYTPGSSAYKLLANPSFDPATGHYEEIDTLEPESGPGPVGSRGIWCHPEISRAEAEDIIIRKGMDCEGSYLLRSKSCEGGGIVLTLGLGGSRFEHHLILWSEERSHFVMDGQEIDNGALLTISDCKFTRDI